MREGAEQLRAEGIDANDAHKAGFDARELLRVGYSVKNLRDAGYSAAQVIPDCSVSALVEAGYDARQLRDASCDALQLRAAGFSAAKVHEAGCSAQEMLDAGFPLDQLHELGVRLPRFSQSAASQVASSGRLEEMRKAGYTATDAKDEGFTAAQLVSHGYPPFEVAQAGYSESELLHAGIVLRIGSAPQSTSQALPLSTSSGGLSQLQRVAEDPEVERMPTVEERRAAEAELAREREAQQAKAAETKRRTIEALTQMHNDGVLAIDALRRMEGSSPTLLWKAGWTMKEFTVQHVHLTVGDVIDLKEAGCAAGPLIEYSGLAISELREAGFTIEEFKNAGIRCGELHQAGATVAELKDSFGEKALLTAGFSAEEISGALACSRTETRLLNRHQRARDHSLPKRESLDSPQWTRVVARDAQPNMN